MGYLLGGGGWTELGGGCADADRMQRCEGVGYGEKIIGQGFASIVWDLVPIAEVGECGACEKVVDRDGIFITAEGTV